MSLSLIIVADKTFIAPLSPWCIEDVETRRQIAPAAVERIFGGASMAVGTERLESVADFRANLKTILASATKNSGGFKVRCAAPYSSPTVFVEGKGISGFLIDGDYHSLQCDENYWTLAKSNPVDKRNAIRRYVEADIVTENWGTVSVVRRKGKSPLDRLLARLDKFLAQQECTSATIVIS